MVAFAVFCKPQKERDEETQGKGFPLRAPLISSNTVTREKKMKRSCFGLGQFTTVPFKSSLFFYAPLIFQLHPKWYSKDQNTLYLSARVDFATSANVFT